MVEQFLFVYLVYPLTANHDEIVANVGYPRGVDALAGLADRRIGGDEEVEKGEEQFPVAGRANVGELRPAQERRCAGERGQGVVVHRVYNVRLELFVSLLFFSMKKEAECCGNVPCCS